MNACDFHNVEFRGRDKLVAAIDDAVAAKAQELTANAKTELDKIRAIG